MKTSRKNMWIGLLLCTSLFTTPTLAQVANGQPQEVGALLEILVAKVQHWIDSRLDVISGG